MHEQQWLEAAIGEEDQWDSARWACIWDTLNRYRIPLYIRRIVANYFSHRILRHDSENGPEEDRVTGGVPQGLVIRPLLWNIMMVC